MRSQPRQPLRIALLYEGRDSDEPAAAGVSELALALRAAGHHPTIFSAHRDAGSRSVECGVCVVRSRRLGEGLLRSRGFTGPLTHVPATVLHLRAGRYDLAHAFSVPDAAAALCWRRLSGRPVAFTWSEPVGRHNLADRRLRLALVRRATSECDAVVAPDIEIRAGLNRWLAIEPLTLEPSDVCGHERLYEALTRRVANTRERP